MTLTSHHGLDIDIDPVAEKHERRLGRFGWLAVAARDKQGLERLDQIKWAVLESSGAISIIPRANASPEA